ERMALLARLEARRVALALDNGIDWVLWDLAMLFSGRVCVPLPGFFSPAQQRHVLDSSGIDTLIAAGRTPEAPGVRAEPGATAELVGACGFEGTGNGVWQRRPANVPVVPAGTLKITYTSGTTGQPKGVCLDGEAQLAVARSLLRASSACDVERHLCVLPLATLLENIAGIYAPLLAGASIELRPMAEIGLQGASSLDLMRFVGALGESRPHSLILLPQLLLALVSAAERGLPLPDSLRFIAVGGGRVAPQLLQRADALGLPVFEGYGLSECASVVCLNTPQARRIGTVGRPLEHVQVRVAADGEVQVRGARMLGYLGEPPLQGGWLHTGDLGHFEDGFLVLHGRIKNQFITAFGRNVNPEWVEAELVQQSPVAQAWLHGEAQAQNVAVLVPRSPACSDAELEAVVASVNSRLPDYARAHHWLRADGPFSAVNGLATPNGRLRREALFEHYRAAIDARLSTQHDEIRA
ncbi:MAG TPA: AMP-binding protein, partial [Quisquiliibacterium sp.]|nr:AMP-binding protein [Quisquiliibacterium sp.]